MKRPNIVIFNPDQMRADSMAHLGNPASVTPNLDSFAREDAVSFRNAYSQSPVCVPSRCSFLTGLYPHVRGHRTMNHMLHQDEKSLFRELKEAGYFVWMNDRNDFLPAQVEGVFDENSSEFYSGKKRGKEYVNPQPESSDEKGFYSFYRGEIQTDSKGKHYSNDDASVDAAIEFLQRRPEEQPFCIFLGLAYPHPEYEVEEPYFSAINPVNLPVRLKTPQALSEMPRMMQELLKMQNLQDLPEEDWEKIRTCYLGMVMKVDAQFGRLCKALKEAGIYDDTDIYFLSDHGDYTGDYGLPEKAQNLYQDCLVNVPLLIKPHKGVQVSPGIADGMTELVDFYATVQDLADLSSSHFHFGKSLRPLLADRNLQNRNFVFCEGGRLAAERLACSETNGEPMDRNLVYYPRLTLQNIDDIAHTKATMIRSDRYKYVFRLYEKHEFYDLERDPGETCNLIDQPEYSEEILKMRYELLKWYQETCDTIPFEQDSRQSPESFWLMIQNQLPENTNISKAEVMEWIRNNTNNIGVFMKLIKNLKMQENPKAEHNNVHPT